MKVNMIKTASELIRNADALLIAAGAGMGIDSGLPDYRGPNGLWKGYKGSEMPNVRFMELANTAYFHTDPELAWGFYGHRYNLYKKTTPHSGFEILRKWLNRMNFGGFVYTSNVDGHFQKSNFDTQHIVECHGSINHLQCIHKCDSDIWSTHSLNVKVDTQTMRATSGIPYCPSCDSVARPNILMFNDRDWVGDRAYEQEDIYRDWVAEARLHNLVVIEIGAGIDIPTVKNECRSHNAPVICINPLHHAVANGIGIPLKALEALKQIDALI